MHPVLHVERFHELQEISAPFPASIDARNTLFDLNTLDIVSPFKVEGCFFLLGRVVTGLEVEDSCLYFCHDFSLGNWPTFNIFRIGMQCCYNKINLYSLILEERARSHSSLRKSLVAAAMTVSWSCLEWKRREYL